MNALGGLPDNGYFAVGVFLDDLFHPREALLTLDAVLSRGTAWAKPA
jgi:hypothetical protein